MPQSSIKDFRHIVNFLKTMLEKNNVRVIYFDKFEFIDFDRTELESFFDKSGISRSMFSFIVELEIPMIISSIIEKDENIFLKRLRDDEESEENLKLEEEKRKLVEDFLVTEEIINNYLIKSSSKLATLLGVDWEINKKVFDDAKGSFPEITYAILNLKVSDPSKATYRLPFIKDENKFHSLVCNLDDIDFLIRTLEEVKKILKVQEG